MQLLFGAVARRLTRPWAADQGFNYLKDTQQSRMLRHKVPSALYTTSPTLTTSTTDIIDHRTSPSRRQL